MGRDIILHGTLPSWGEKKMRVWTFFLVFFFFCFFACFSISILGFLFVGFILMHKKQVIAKHYFSGGFMEMKLTRNHSIQQEVLEMCWNVSYLREKIFPTVIMDISLFTEFCLE